MDLGVQYCIDLGLITVVYAFINPDFRCTDEWSEI